MSLAQADPTLSDLSDDTSCQRLLVNSWRRIVIGAVYCPVLDASLRKHCREHADEVLAALCGFLCAIGLTRRRRMLIAYPGCRDCTTDELRLLSMVAAAQHHCPALLEAHLCWVARLDMRNVLAGRTRKLAVALESCTLRLPLPDGQPEARACA